jgi:hypothetical protein
VFGGATPVPPPGASSGKRFVLGVVLAGVAFLAFVRACSSSGPAPTAGELEASGRQWQDAQEIGQAEYAVRQTLRDPSSARFENVAVVRNAGSVAVCGAVNARNGFGGYAGAARFMARNQTALVESAANTRAFSQTWNRACVAR